MNSLKVLVSARGVTRRGQASRRLARSGRALGKIVMVDDNSLQKYQLLTLTCPSIVSRVEISTQQGTKEKNSCHYKLRSSQP